MKFSRSRLLRYDLETVALAIRYHWLLLRHRDYWHQSVAAARYRRTAGRPGRPTAIRLAYMDGFSSTMPRRRRRVS